MQGKGCRFLFVEQTSRERGQDKGRTGRAVGPNVRRARERLGIDLAALAKRLTDAGWPIAKSALSRLENGQRRVDVDDLMALAVVLHVSPLELLLGADDQLVTPTAVPDGLLRDELWAWAAGDVELDPESLIEWWRGQIAVLGSRIEVLDALDDNPALPPEAQERTRRWVLKERNDVQRQWQRAVKRISELSGDDAKAGVAFDMLPANPLDVLVLQRGDNGESEATS
jgi:transcriptional regulator with XRE-family HTH domain